MRGEQRGQCLGIVGVIGFGRVLDDARMASSSALLAAPVRYVTAGPLATGPLPFVGPVRGPTSVSIGVAAAGLFAVGLMADRRCASAATAMQRMTNPKTRTNRGMTAAFLLANFGAGFLTPPARTCLACFPLLSVSK